MTLYSEIDWTGQIGGKIVSIESDSVAAEIGIILGDELLAIDENAVQDVIDVQYYSAEEYFELLIRRGEEYLLFEAEREYQQSLGLSFEHPTFDTDIRRCNNLCEFCFVLQMAPCFRRTLYIKDDDYRYSFLFGHFVTLTNLTDHDWWRIETMGLSPLYVSVHVTDLELRRQFLRNPKAPDIMKQLRWLSERGIEVHTQLVVVPEFNDGVWLDQSIKELAELWPSVRSISVVPVGLTRHHKYKMRPHTPGEAAEMLDYLESLQPIYQEKFGIRFVYPTDEWYLVSDREVPPAEANDGQELQENGLGMVRNFLDDWGAIKDEIWNWTGATRPDLDQEVTLVTGTLFGPTLEKTAAEFANLTGVNVRVQQIINDRFGDTITAAGLLMAADVLVQLKMAGYGDLVVLPRVIFDHPDVISLDDMTPQQVTDELGAPVALADLMGDIWDALVGESAVMFYPP